MLFTVAVAHATTILAAPGPTEDAHGMIVFLLFCFAKAVATWHIPCSLRPCMTRSSPGSVSKASPSPTAIPCPNNVKKPSTNFVSFPSIDTYWLSRNLTMACATVSLIVFTISAPSFFRVLLACVLRAIYSLTLPLFYYFFAFCASRCIFFSFFCLIPQFF